MGNRKTAFIQANIGVVVSLCLSLFSSAFAKTSDVAAGKYSEILSLLEKEEFKQASERLEILLTENPSAAGYYNLAIAYEKLSRRSESAWALASAKALGGVSGDEKLTRNLQRNIPVELWPLSVNPVATTWKRTANLFGSPVWEYGGIGFWLLGFVFLAIRFFRKKTQVLGIAGFVMICFGAVFLLLGMSQLKMLESRTAVAMQPSSLFEAPSEGSERIRTLPVGTNVEFGEELSGFAKVMLPTAEAGWVPISDFKRVLSKD